MRARLLLLGFVSIGLGQAAWASTAAIKDISDEPKPRLLVLTDISNEPDDEESLVRLLVYSNEFDLEGLVATTSVWLRDKVRPDLIARDIQAYAQVRDNLLRHARNFPSAEVLLAKTKASCPVFGMDGVGEGKATEGSRLIIEAAGG